MFKIYAINDDDDDDDDDDDEPYPSVMYFGYIYLIIFQSSVRVSQTQTQTHTCREKLAAKGNTFGCRILQFHESKSGTGLLKNVGTTL